MIEYSTKLKSYPNFIYIKAQVVERIHIIEKKNIIIIYFLFIENSMEKRFMFYEMNLKMLG